MMATIQATYRVKDDAGQTHDCYIHSFKVVKVPERGLIINLWFTSTIWMPEPVIYGVYIYGILDDRVVMDGRVECLSEHAQAKLERMLARALNMRYQTTPLLRLGGDAGMRKEYTKDR